MVKTDGSCVNSSVSNRWIEVYWRRCDSAELERDHMIMLITFTSRLPRSQSSQRRWARSLIQPPRRSCWTTHTSKQHFSPTTNTTCSDDLTTGTLSRVHPNLAPHQLEYLTRRRLPSKQRPHRINKHTTHRGKSTNMSVEGSGSTRQGEEGEGGF